MVFGGKKGKRRTSYVSPRTSTHSVLSYFSFCKADNATPTRLIA